MKKLLVGNAPCSWGTMEHQDQSKAIPYSQMLDELVEMGYTGTELGDWGYMPTDPVRLREELARRNNIAILGVYVDDADRAAAEMQHNQRGDSGFSAFAARPIGTLTQNRVMHRLLVHNR
jgi:sugar phosphate isomerase/epimerase